LRLQSCIFNNIKIFAHGIVYFHTAIFLSLWQKGRESNLRPRVGRVQEHFRIAWAWFTTL